MLACVEASGGRYPEAWGATSWSGLTGSPAHGDQRGHGLLTSSPADGDTLAERSTGV